MPAKPDLVHLRNSWRVDPRTGQHYHLPDWYFSISAFSGLSTDPANHGKPQGPIQFVIDISLIIPLVSLAYQFTSFGARGSIFGLQASQEEGCGQGFKTLGRVLSLAPPSFATPFLSHKNKKEKEKRKEKKPLLASSLFQICRIPSN